MPLLQIPEATCNEETINQAVSNLSQVDRELYYSFADIYAKDGDAKTNVGIYSTNSMVDQETGLTEIGKMIIFTSHKYFLSNVATFFCVSVCVF